MDDGSSELVPRTAPIPGGGRCDVCGRRSFRRLARLDLYRHVACESIDARLSSVEASARDDARRLNALAARDPEDLEGLRLADVLELPLRTNGTGTEP
jgi:hypothetical protein